MTNRSDCKADDTWNLEAMYQTEEDWNLEFEENSQLPIIFVPYKGKLNSPEVLREVLDLYNDGSRVLDKLYVYASLRRDQDLDNNHSQIPLDKINQLNVDFETATSFIEPELMKADLKSWVDLPILKPHRRFLLDLLRQTDHVLTEKEEELLSMLSIPLSTTEEIFLSLNNVEIPRAFGEITDEGGGQKEITAATLNVFLRSPDQEVRYQAFYQFLSAYHNHRNTLAKSLEGHVRGSNVIAKLRGFSSACTASLHSDFIPEKVYSELIQEIHNQLPKFHRYMGVRKRHIQKRDDLDGFHVYDVKAPLLPTANMEFTWEESEKLILESLKPLGDEYQQIASGGFQNRWCDKFENTGKISGAYSGGCYDSMPYILMNFSGTLQDVSTLTHELGHSCHSALSRGSQPYQTSYYSLFVAEVASTVNETLLFLHMLEQTQDPKVKAYLIDDYLDQFRGTIFRQTMFAEFERTIFQEEQRGTSLTSDYLDEYYYKLSQKYYGDNFDWDEEDKLVSSEWSFIPHFYYNFYVYKYATGMISAISIVNQILTEGSPAVERYLNFLRAGGSEDPMILLKNAGVDLTTSKPFHEAFQIFEENLNRLDQLLNEI